MTRFSIRSNSEKETIALGSRLGELCRAGDVVLLSGELGTGKTCFVKGMAAGLNVAEVPFSPSFVLVREYHGRLPLYHMDFYRVENPWEVVELGINDYLNGDGVCAIEWAERADTLLPDECMRVTISYVPSREVSRDVVFEATGPRHSELLQGLATATGATVSWN